MVFADVDFIQKIAPALRRVIQTKRLFISAGGCPLRGCSITKILRENEWRWRLFLDEAADTAIILP